MRNWCEAVLALDVIKAKQTFPFAEKLAACPHDPLYHSEGDVWVHTQMVIDRVLEHPTYLAGDEATQQVLLLSAFLHDIAKPQTTVELWDETQNRTRISQPGHAKAGAKQALDLLWHAGLEWQKINQVYWLIAWHQKPFHIWNAKDMLRQAIEFSWIGAWPLLLALVEADNLGRISPNVQETAADLELLRIWLKGENLWQRAFPFANDTSRIAFFEKADRYAGYAEPEQSMPIVYILCGLPGAGKDTYAKSRLADLPIMSLDTIREEMDISPRENQGRVVQEAMERARGHLRAKQDFVWNAVNVSRLNRGRAIKLCRDYGFRVEVHALVPPASRLYQQNKARSSAVPENVIAALARKWEPPTLTEAHAVHWVEG